jgi:hypothetical protein
MSLGLQVSLGQLVATPAALESVTQEQMLGALRRHVSADWGDVDKEDWKTNDYALAHGERLLSAYHTEDGTKFWIITECDRSATTVLLPEDY